MAILGKMAGASGASLALLAGYVLARTRKALPRTGGELVLDGIEHQVDVRFDQWGVPHIRARSLSDALLAQGYVAAQDRMIQMEILRRIASGRLSEVLGRPALGLDVFMRDLGLRRTADRMVRELPEDTLHYLDRYVVGVNAYLEDRRRSLPIELLLAAMGKPRAWATQDCLLMLLFLNWTMDATWTADLMRGRLIRRLGHEAARRLLPPCGPGNVPVVTYDGEAVSRTSIPPPEECELEFFESGNGLPGWIMPGINVRAQGSNNWVVAGKRSSTGKPILCNDPHLQHGLPTLFHLCHLTADDPPCNVAGAGLPGIPGILMGRNDRIAWGSTSLAPDVADLYIEEFEGGESTRYLREGAWVEAETWEEEIRVFPGRVVRYRVVWTGHGPVIARCGSKALALRWVGHDAANDSAGCIVRMGLAGDPDEFTRALEGYSGPAVNLVYADVDGNIAYHVAGRIPVREGHDGSVPVPGWEGGLEWKGYLPLRELPHDLNPERGWIATANNQVVGDGYPHLIATLWEPSCRQERIAEMLSAAPVHDLDGMRRIQGDLFSCHGAILRRELLDAAQRWDDPAPRTREALLHIGEWDSRAEASSVAQSLCNVTWKVLTERLLRHRLGHRLYFEYTTSFPNLNHAVEGILTARDGEWLPPSAPDFDQLLRDCLEEAILRLATRFGTPDMRRWQWGRLHRLEIPHLLSSIKPLRRILNLGPVPHGGDGETVCSAFAESDPTIQLLARSSLGGDRGLDFAPRFYSDHAYGGPVFRMIVDLSDRDASLWCLDAGQSSNPLSPFYSNFFVMWRGLEYAPMALSENKVGEVTRSTLRINSRFGV